MISNSSGPVPLPLKAPPVKFGALVTIALDVANRPTRVFVDGTEILAAKSVLVHGNPGAPLELELRLICRSLNTMREADIPQGPR